MRATEPCEHVSRRYNCPIHSPRRIWANYKRDAGRKGLSFSISLRQFQALVSAPCFLCSATPALGLDRWSNAGSYTLRNVRPMCQVCNFLKGDKAPAIFLEHVRRMAYNSVGVEGMKFL